MGETDMSTDHQIAEKVIAAVKDSDEWKFVPNDWGIPPWMAKGNIRVVTNKEEPWDCVRVYVDDVEWKIPPPLKKDIWEAAWPTFEKAEIRHREQLNAQILSKL